VNRSGASISIIIPSRNEASGIAAAIASARSPQTLEILLADGQSTDDTVAIAHRLGANVVAAPPGRARQMNAGAQIARGKILLFLHADSTLPEGFGIAVEAALADPRVPGGRFDIHFPESRIPMSLVAFLMNQRSRFTGIATGDQAIFLRREIFARLGGYPDQPLMEDIELTRRMRRFGPPAALRQRVQTSARRWQHHGVVRTIVLMWALRFAYFVGVAPTRLARIYYPPRSVGGGAAGTRDRPSAS
jgi:rSAM/selenodomain-associated transferase 2